MINTAEQLINQYGFSEEIAASVGDMADRQRHDYGSYQEFLAKMGADEPGLKVLDYADYKPVQILDIRPTEHDPAHALLIHVAMANTLDPNQLYQIATIAHANPGKRIIAAGNPGAPGYTASRQLTHSQRKATTHGDFQSTVEPLFKYLDEQGIDITDHYGYSYGTVSATTAVELGNTETKHCLLLDPAHAKKWNSIPIYGLGKFLKAFSSTSAALSEYVEMSEAPVYEAARTDSPGALVYTAGLARLSNIAVGRGLANGGFESKTRRTLEAQPDMVLTAAWGTASEFNINNCTEEQVVALYNEFGERVIQRPLRGHKHAVANDIFFQAALVKEALARNAA